MASYTEDWDYWHLTEDTIAHKYRLVPGGKFLAICKAKFHKSFRNPIQRHE
ncbi:hypothetical protein D3C72_1324310 [compost metagenome]